MGAKILLVFTVIISAGTVLAIPVPSEVNGRSIRSVNSNRRNPWDETPMASFVLPQQQQQQPNTSLEAVLARREIGDGITNLTGDGSISGSIGSNGTLGNETVSGSRLMQNETECLEPSSLCSSNSTVYNRDKQRRIAHIVNYVWTNLFGNRTRPAINKEMIRERISQPAPPTSSQTFSGDLESISTSCDLPPEVESEAWSSERLFNMYFNLTSKYPDILGPSLETSEQEQPGQPERLPSTGTRPVFTTTILTNKAVNVISAKLRLYKIGLSETDNVPSFTDVVPSEPCNDTETTSLDEMLPTPLPIGLSPTPPEEKIRVSVFQYTKPTTKNHYKKRLLDTKMLSLGESQWVEFDIKTAVTGWLNDRKPNYGLVVEVENENQDTLNPSKYFQGATCFKTSGGPVKQQSDDNTSIRGSSNGKTITISTSPLIEICTINVPEVKSEPAKFFPYSINQNSLDHLQRIADSHAKAGNRGGTQRLPWQNINLSNLSPDDFRKENERTSTSSSTSQKPTTVVVHRHRHHHEASNRNSNDGNNRQLSHSLSGHPRVILDEDHPLREILASVNGNSKENGKRRAAHNGSYRLSSESLKGLMADQGKTENDDDSTEHDGDVFITKIVMTTDQLKQNALNGRGMLPLPLSSVSPTVVEDMESDSDR